jgi:hypothetical protein
VCVTEKRSPADIDRLADGSRAGWQREAHLREVAIRAPRRRAAALRGPAAGRRP